jgi:integrase
MASMGRRPSKNMNLPTRMRARRRGQSVYYFYDTGAKPRKEIPLGKDYVTAIQKWAELQGDKPAASLITFKDVADRYILEVLPGKAKATRVGNLRELGKLLEFFNDPPAPLDSITAQHVRQYMDWRGQEAKTRANREKALFSHIWNKARSWGATNQPNPCTGIKGFEEKGRDIYIEDDVLEAVWNAGDNTLRDALDLAYLTGQRPADVLGMSATDIREGMLRVRQGKTDQKLRIEIVGELEELMTRIEQRKAGVRIHSLALICTDTGRALTKDGLRSRFENARLLAAKSKPEIADAIKAFQFRDLRAKAGTDKADESGIRAAQMQLGHTNITMTEHYIRARLGERVKPTK